MKNHNTNHRDIDISTTSGFRPINKQHETGAKAIQVEHIPDGVIGRPVEFQSKN